MEESLYYNIVLELCKRVKEELAERSDDFDIRMLKTEKVILCSPRVRIIRDRETARLSGHIGEYKRATIYDEEFLNRFLGAFVNTSKFYRSASKQIAEEFLGGDAAANLFAELYITLLCRKIAVDLLTKGDLKEEEVADSVRQFAIDTREGGLRVSIVIGSSGVAIAEKVVLKSNKLDVVIRPPELTDIPSQIIVPDRWEVEIDPRNYPKVPNFCSVIEVYPHSLTIEPLRNSFLHVQMYDSNHVFDKFVGALYAELYDIHDFLILFQSKNVPLFETTKILFSLKNLSSRPIYEKTVPVKESGFVINDPFVIIPETYESLRKWWDRLHSLSFRDRIYGTAARSEIGMKRFERPLEVAFTRYNNILFENKEVKVKIHDIVEAIEGFHTPEKVSNYTNYRKYRKIFIDRVSNLVQIAKIDGHDNSIWILNEGFRIRSEYSHRASGWDDEDLEKDDTNQQLRRSDTKFLRDLSSTLLNYLRLSIVARIIAGKTDREFIRLLDSRDRNEIAVLLQDLNDLIIADPLPSIEEYRLKTSLHPES